MGRVTYIEYNGAAHTIEIDDGVSLMEGAVANGIRGIDADCGGSRACATCHVHVDGAWLQKVGPPTSEAEAQMLQLAPESAADSRLSCPDCNATGTRRRRRASPRVATLSAESDMTDTLAAKAGPPANYTLAQFADAPHTTEEARADAYSTPLERIDVANPKLFHNDVIGPYFERLRREDPVHQVENPVYGKYWSITKYQDIMAIDTNHKQFSSESTLGGITIFGEGREPLPMFIAMDPPKHDVQRKAVTPMFAPANLKTLEPLIRERAAKILDSLPIGEEFDWVDKVSMELTAMTLATLFDFPQAERRKLTRWSDVATAVPGAGVIESREQWVTEMTECFTTFQQLWNERARGDGGSDLISMLARGEETRHMPPHEFQGNVVLLIVGGNDTTRNTITGSVLALNQNSDQYDKLRARPELIPSMVSETIRWQTPLAHMRRTALEDVEFRGKHIRKGDKVVMWYISGNRDDEAIAEPERYRIDRERPRQHVSFGYGIHRCLGNRLAELQLQIVWEEILKRFPRVEVAAAPERVYSTFVRGYRSLRVRIPIRS